MNVMFFLDCLLLGTSLILDIIYLTLLNSYWLINEIHWSFIIEIIIFPLNYFWRIRPYVFSIDKNTQSSSLSNSYKLPLPLSDMLYKNDGGSKVSIGVIIDAKTLRVLVNMYLLSTTCSELLLLDKCIRTIGGHLVTVTSVIWYLF